MDLVLGVRASAASDDEAEIEIAVRAHRTAGSGSEERGVPEGDRPTAGTESFEQGTPEVGQGGDRIGGEVFSVQGEGLRPSGPVPVDEALLDQSIRTVPDPGVRPVRYQAADAPDRQRSWGQRQHREDIAVHRGGDRREGGLQLHGEVRSDRVEIYQIR
ncbi:hypothetical protein [Curtobacterium sp. VKM Ac-2852]|uniref:hypothetical protein n=1 Tax=Curtobacterium sp. VKM Ac-2852 TaxID=2739024 RepID=UPI0020B12804|nr:hypothetical protein [Curtobacterium sp. VKM Ac-2852]